MGSVWDPTNGEGVEDNTDELYIPYKKNGKFENSPMKFEELENKILSDKSLEVPTGSHRFSDASILTTNTNLLEVQNCVNQDVFELIGSKYDETGSQVPVYSEKAAATIVDISLLDDAQSDSWSYTFPPAPIDLHFISVFVLPKETGIGVFRIWDEDANGCILNTETSLEFTQDDVDNAALPIPIPREIVISNRIRIFPGQSNYVEYEGPALGGHNYIGHPIFGTGFVAWTKNKALPITEKNLALEENQISPAERTKLSEITDTGSGIIISDAERTKLDGLTGGRYLGVFADLIALQTAHPTAVSGDTATVTSPNANLFYWNGASWADSGTGYIGDMLKAVYDPTPKNANAFSMDNMDETATKKILTDTERTNLSNQSGTNTGDITLNADDPTQESLNLSGQELQANQATQSTDGVMSSEDKTKFDNICSSCGGDGWVSGLQVVENAPKDQKVQYGAGTYLINGVIKTITPSGIYDLENAYGSVDHYSGMVDDQHAFVNVYVDNDEVIKSERGDIGEKGEIIFPPLLPDNSVCIAVIEIKVDKNDIPKDISNKYIDDCRHSVSVNTDEFVSISADDTTTGHLADKLSNNGNVKFTIENPSGAETLKANVIPGIISYTTAAHIDGLDVSSLYPVGILMIDTGGNREIKSFTGGTHGQILHVVNNDNSDLKFKHQNGAEQELRVEGAADKTCGDYGGATLVYNGTDGYWMVIGIIV